MLADLEIKKLCIVYCFLSNLGHRPCSQFELKQNKHDFPGLFDNCPGRVAWLKRTVAKAESPGSPHWRDQACVPWQASAGRCKEQHEPLLGFLKMEGCSYLERKPKAGLLRESLSVNLQPSPPWLCAHDVQRFCNLTFRSTNVRERRERSFVLSLPDDMWMRMCRERLDNWETVFWECVWGLPFSKQRPIFGWPLLQITMFSLPNENKIFKHIICNYLYI